MTVTNVTKDTTAHTMTITTEFDAPVEAVWQLWADPRRLEKWWGPPSYPATVVEHDLTPGGRVSYFMTGPDGDQPRGWWRVVAVDAPHRLEIEDGFADDEGNPNDKLPTMRMTVAVEAAGAVTRMSIRTTFPTAEAMEQILSMGAEEGMKQALGQIEDVLAA